MQHTDFTSQTMSHRRANRILIRKFNKPIKNPADNDDTQSLRDYLKHFESCAVVALFLAAGLPTAHKKCSCLIVIIEIMPKLWANWSFGSVLKNSLSYTRCVCTTVANWKRKCSSSCCGYPVYVQFSLSGLLSGHSRKIDVLKDQDNRLRLGT